MQYAPQVHSVGFVDGRIQIPARNVLEDYVVRFLVFLKSFASLEILDFGERKQLYVPVIWVNPELVLVVGPSGHQMTVSGQDQ